MVPSDQMPAVSGVPDKRVVREAVAWMMRLEAGGLAEDELRAWKSWRGASPSHETAWRKVQLLSDKLQTLPPELCVPVLTRETVTDRRTILKALGVAGLAVPLFWGASRQMPWQRWNADYSTGAGEQRHIALEDGGSVLMNTLGSLNVRYTATERLLILLEGDILVQTAGRRDPRPLYVETVHGRMQALGTRFMVQLQRLPRGTDVSGSTPLGDSTLLSVQEHRVALTLAQSEVPALIVESGQKVRFGPGYLGPVLPLKPQDSGWADGVLYANDTPLGEFLDELSRYRPGVIRYTPEVGRLRITGAYQLPDSDRILETLSGVLPIKVSLRSRYWVHISLR